jgi:Leucine-rich repeat (LRR) protein
MIRVASCFVLFLVLGCSSRKSSEETTLIISNKGLTAIPDSVFLMTHLESLDLGNNFTLYPPLSALGQDFSLGEGMNSIAEIPGKISRLRKLRTLGFCFNDLRSLPKDIVDLRKLDTLDLSFNANLEISGQMQVLRQMKRLKYLNIVATRIDKATIEELRKALPNTHIEAEIRDLRRETVDTTR